MSFRSLVDDWTQMTKNDGYDNWRQEERKKLDKNIQQRFHDLQNPEDCNQTKVLYCSFPSWSGSCGWGELNSMLFHCFPSIWFWGCGVHKFADCFSIAYGLGRMLIYDGSPFLYTQHDAAYHPVSENCSKISIDDNENARNWPGELEI